MKIYTKIALFSATIAALTDRTTVSAFTPSPSFTKPTRTKNVCQSPMNMVVPGHEHMINDLDSLQTSIQSAQDLFHMNIQLHSSMLLSDAADAVADAASDAAKDDGWWQSYLKFFKGGLVFVHSAVEEPLRNAGFTETWGPSIALFTLGVRSLVLPLSFQQAKATEYTKALKPYQDEIKIKFKDNKDMMNRATAKLFEDAGTNPLTGCFISLSQIPIFLGLYRSITLLAKDGKIDEPFLWIPSLQGPVTGPNFRGMEWLTEGWTFPDGGLPIPHLGWETTLAFLVMPVVLVLQQKLNLSILTPETDTSTMSEEEKEQFEKSQGILKFLPLLIGYFSLQVPAGLTIYWFTSNLFTVSQSLAVKAYYKANPPEIELPDYWEGLDNIDELSPEKKRQMAEAGINTGPTFDDLLDEAQFHYVVDRNPLREESAAWKRVMAASGGAKIPTEFETWVGEATASIEKETEVETANVD